MRKISQRTANALRKQVKTLTEELSQIRTRYGSDFPGPRLYTLNTSGTTACEVLDVARKLGFGLAVKTDGKELKIYAVRVGG